MVQQVLNDLKTSLHEALYLDLDDFGLETQGSELISKFIGVQLKSAFQPILDARKGDALVGHEALLRPAIGPEALTTQFAFDFADKQGRLVKLDRVARTLHLLNYQNLPEAKRGLLFLNVHPKLLATVNAHGKVFERILHNHSVPTHQVVIELQESAVDIDKHLHEAVGNYRDRSYRLAIDGFGGRRTNLERLWQVSPDFVKLDRTLLRDTEQNAKARRVLAKLIELVQEIGATPIVQGVETESQKQIALDAGASILQGFYLGTPESASTWLTEKSADAIKAAA